MNVRTQFNAEKSEIGWEARNTDAAMFRPNLAAPRNSGPRVDRRSAAVEQKRIEAVHHIPRDKLRACQLAVLFLCSNLESPTFAASL